MQIFNGLDKNILILIVVGLAASGLIMSVSNKNIPNSSLISSVLTKNNTAAAIDKDIIELGALGADLSMLAENDAISAEIDDTLNEMGELDEAAITLTGDENELNGLVSDLGSLSGDEAIDKEIDQILNEAAL